MHICNSPAQNYACNADSVFRSMPVDWQNPSRVPQQGGNWMRGPHRRQARAHGALLQCQGQVRDHMLSVSTLSFHLSGINYQWCYCDGFADFAGLVTAWSPMQRRRVWSLQERWSPHSEKHQTKIIIKIVHRKLLQFYIRELCFLLVFTSFGNYLSV
jgi:hypothetical protein